MFTAEVSQRTQTFKTSLLRALAAAFVTVLTVQMFGVALHRMQMQDQNETMVLAMELLASADGTRHVEMLSDTLTASKLAAVDNSKLHQMLGSTLQYFVSLQMPARASDQIVAELQTTSILADAAPAKLVLANELNAALLYEDVLARIETLNIEKARRIAFAEIG